eukprot:CAMPEP_0172759016 /NCGR_PEP_ID=MMETSP1074-20121228/166892_1 /TAXON_ID=2916 /ORGANISM="Ceratium fusus, Strain PA161109" /LENGTH=157 /DNA_ID=CAMNT_0013592709 /DNA_START=197 /DNA_END=668 /DNA_ORIENTATION=+
MAHYLRYQEGQRDSCLLGISSLLTTQQRPSRHAILGFGSNMAHQLWAEEGRHGALLGKGFLGAVSNAPAAMPLTALAGDRYRMCGLTKDSGTVLCWGFDNSGKNKEGYDNTPLSVLAAGYTHTCGIKKANRRVLCWGSGATIEVSNAPATETFAPSR